MNSEPLAGERSSLIQLLQAAAGLIKEPLRPRPVGTAPARRPHRRAKTAVNKSQSSAELPAYRADDAASARPVIVPLVYLRGSLLTKVVGVFTRQEAGS